MKSRRRAFTLVEILIVVMIIGILAAIAVPKFSNASQSARESSLKEDLQHMRTAIGVYKSQHGSNPGYPGGDTAQTPTSSCASDQLTLFSDTLGHTSATSSSTYRWGPYLNLMPVNPLNNKADFKILADTDAFTPDDSTGWLYQPSTGLVKPNVSAVDSTSHPVLDY